MSEQTDLVDLERLADLERRIEEAERALREHRAVCPGEDDGRRRSDSEAATKLDDYLRVRGLHAAVEAKMIDEIRGL